MKDFRGSLLPPLQELRDAKCTWAVGGAGDLGSFFELYDPINKIFIKVEDRSQSKAIDRAVAAWKVAR
jgi:hypothetical protein